MRKSTHCAFVATAFGISSAGFAFGGYPVLGGALLVLAMVYAALSFRAREREREQRNS